MIRSEKLLTYLLQDCSAYWQFSLFASLWLFYIGMTAHMDHYSVCVCDKETPSQDSSHIFIHFISVHVKFCETDTTVQ